ncbi:hypothetical protein DFH28DRAFT_1120670 [Melampsora americana]|nr:hypothetical protein DFH28DRAFT_1120670 [Melampsora americana]
MKMIQIAAESLFVFIVHNQEIPKEKGPLPSSAITAVDGQSVKLPPSSLREPPWLQEPGIHWCLVSDGPKPSSLDDEVLGTWHQSLADLLKCDPTECEEGTVHYIFVVNPDNSTMRRITKQIIFQRPSDNKATFAAYDAKVLDIPMDNIYKWLEYELFQIPAIRFEVESKSSIAENCRSHDTGA